MFINLTLAKERLFANECIKWSNEILLVPELRFYSIFKENYRVETFVKLIQNRKKRAIISQFRYIVLPLKIETGRFQDIPIEYRFCIFCEDNVIESELHFLLHCSHYNEIRFEFYNKVREIDFYFDILDDEDKIRKLMSDDIIKYTVNYLKKFFEKRQQTLYL